jgi:hypothetical protein
MDGALRTATTGDLHHMLVEAVKSSQISGSQSIHHQKSSSYYRDEKNQILDLFSGEGGRLDSYRTARGSQSDVISNQIMIKKVGAELDRSPKRLRSIMDNQ